LGHLVIIFEYSFVDLKSLSITRSQKRAQATIPLCRKVPDRDSINVEAA